MAIYEKKNGRYAVRVDDRPTLGGKRQRRSLGTFRRLKDAKKAERDALTKRD